MEGEEQQTDPSAGRDSWAGGARWSRQFRRFHDKHSFSTAVRNALIGGRELSCAPDYASNHCSDKADPRSDG
jgi:hypothetical protein